MQGLAPSEIFLFEDFRLDRRGGLYRRDDVGAFVPVAIGSRALDILGVLIEPAGEVVTKDEIIAAVWPGTVVEASNLTVQISALRAVLDRGRANGSCIQTVSGRGYRFAARVTRCGTDPPPTVGGNGEDRGAGAPPVSCRPTAASTQWRAWHKIAVLLAYSPCPGRWRRGFGIIAGLTAPPRGRASPWWCCPLRTSVETLIRSISSMRSPAI